MAHSKFDAVTWDEPLALLWNIRVLGDCDQSKYAEELVDNGAEADRPDIDSRLLAR